MIPDLALDVTPPEIAQQVHRIIYEITGSKDPYLKTKKRANKSALSLYTHMKNLVDNSNNSLETACKLAIAGNAIDLGARVDIGSIYSMVEGSIGYQLDQEHYRQFKESILQSYLIIYIADNAGEIVFDRILIEQLLEIKKLRVLFVVREKPIMNDATLDDTLEVDLNKVATIISTGTGAPATILSQCSTKMKGFYQAADLIISKGQENYVSLSDRPENIFFLFKVKCPVVAGDCRYDIDSPVLISSTVVKNVES